MGRPSLLTVDIPIRGGITVNGPAWRSMSSRRIAMLVFLIAIAGC